jgi:dolichyl-phosphate-mannose-protein mannosyltransferase
MTLNPPSDRWSRAWIAAILVVAAWLRLQGLDWDDGQHLHPDERFLTMVGAAIKPPHSLAEYFDTGRSPLNPVNHGDRFSFFVYGTLPLFVVRWLGQWLGKTGYSHIYLVGRVLSALCDCGTVWLTAWLGTRLAGRRVGLFAGALVALSVASIQNAHFFTVDSAATFFATAALCELVELADTASFRAQLVFGALFGATLGCRINLALLGDVYPLALLCAWLTRRAGVTRLAAGAVAAGLAAALVFRVVQPYAFAGPGFFDLRIAPNFLTSLRMIQIFATGAADYPPAVQWVGRTPIVFAGKNLLLWGIGPAWGLAAVGGILWWLVRRRSLRGAMVLAWALVLFGYHSVQFTATGRYFLPIVPVLAVFAAWPFGAGARPSSVTLGWLVVALTALWALAFTSIYRRQMTRVEASRWIYQNVPAGSAIATEHWDDGLPLDLADLAPAHYRSIQLELYDDDNQSKRSTLIDQLAAADYIAISSNRLYRSIPRTPWRYPLTRRYYELLFSGALGFRLERSFTSYPRLGSFEIRDDDAEEAFTVYDHPRVLIFKKTEAFSRERVAELLGAAPLGTIRVTPRKASELYRRIRPTDIPLPESEAVRTAVAAKDEPSLGAFLRWLATLTTPAVPEAKKTPIGTVPPETAGAAAPPLGVFREPRGLARAPDG